MLSLHDSLVCVTYLSGFSSVAIVRHRKQRQTDLFTRHISESRIFITDGALSMICSLKFSCYLAGWRLDYFLVSEILANRVYDSYILPDVNGSDHCPIGLILKM